MNTLNFKKPDWVPYRFLKNDENDLFKKDNKVNKGNKYYIIIILNYLSILFIET